MQSAESFTKPMKHWADVASDDDSEIPELPPLNCCHSFPARAESKSTSQNEDLFKIKRTTQATPNNNSPRLHTKDTTKAGEFNNPIPHHSSFKEKLTNNSDLQFDMNNTNRAENLVIRTEYKPEDRRPDIRKQFLQLCL